MVPAAAVGVPMALVRIIKLKPTVDYTVGLYKNLKHYTPIILFFIFSAELPLYIPYASRVSGSYSLKHYPNSIFSRIIEIQKSKVDLV